MKKRKKYLSGTRVKAAQTPAEALREQQNMIDLARAKYENSVGSKIMKGVAQFVPTLTSMITQAASSTKNNSTNNGGIGSDMIDSNSSNETGNSIPDPTMVEEPKFAAFGGKIGNSSVNINEELLRFFAAFGGNVQDPTQMGQEGEQVPVEVEGGEVAETPEGEILEFDGPDHGPEGGIKGTLEEGTEMFSKRIKRKNESLATRKLKREEKMSKIKSKLAENSTDAVLKGSLTRLEKINEIEESSDLELMELISAASELDKQKMAFGGMIKKYGWGDTIGGSAGDLTSMVGNFISTFGPLMTTMQNKAGDTPNTNAFENYGAEGLETYEGTKNAIASQTDQALKSLDMEKTEAMNKNRNTARGVNTMRAGDLELFNKTEGLKTDIYNKEAEMISKFLQGKVDLLNARDAQVMSGEASKELADKEDRDNFYTQLNLDRGNVGKGLQESGKDINAMKYNSVMQNLMKNLSPHGIEVDGWGNITDDSTVYEEASKLKIPENVLAAAKERGFTTLSEIKKFDKDVKSGKIKI